ncbi:MAG: chemotaxis-specific protein-glutamate methyltransferase CheB [Phycisphaeraceae bacterium]|nr:chemotaxis-specific protein-glutamate methyltransferase CheB [Phycisphaeraceae bacterium]
MRIAIVNDLKLAVEALRRSIATIPGATIAWIAEDGAQAVEKCARDLPDIVLMDMIMPVMDGVEATRRIMKATPCPILVVTATVEGNSGKVFEALGAGALDAVATPGLAAGGGVERAEALAKKVQAIWMIAGAGGTPGLKPFAFDANRSHAPTPPIVAIGSSTGGPLALAQVLKAIPSPAPWPIVIVQHVDIQFAAGLASWLGGETGHAVATVASGEIPVAGCVKIAATTDHLLLDSGGRLVYSPLPREAVFRPSVDVFFESLAARSAARGVAVVLTGMGRDGAEGMGRLRREGWHTIAQDRATSVVWGMPGACVQADAAIEVLGADSIGVAIVQAMANRSGESGRQSWKTHE